MSSSYVIEIADEAVGLVHRQSDREPYRFLATDRRLATLDGQSFRRPSQAEAAAREVLRRRRKAREALRGLGATPTLGEWTAAFAIPNAPAR